MFFGETRLYPLFKWIRVFVVPVCASVLVGGDVALSELGACVVAEEEAELNIGRTGVRSVLSYL